MNTHDAILRQHAPFRRYSSLTEAGININDLHVIGRDQINQMTKEYREKFTRLLSSKFTKATWKRSESGASVNVDEAIAGESECFRRRLPHKSPVRIGINLSAKGDTKNEMYALRGAAVLALIDLCKSRGQSVIVEIAYGNGVTCERAYHCHVRIALPMPTIETLTRVNCSFSTMEQVGTKCVKPLNPAQRWRGIYRFAEFPWKQEYDFVLDRIETGDVAAETKRIMDALERFKLV